MYDIIIFMYIIIFISFTTIFMFFVSHIKNLKRKKSELDSYIDMFDNEDEIKTTEKRVIPDNVHEDSPTATSTQSIDCKKYESVKNNNVERIRVNEKLEENYFYNKEELDYQEEPIMENSVFDSSEDGPIQEEESFISKIFGTSTDDL